MTPYKYPPPPEGKVTRKNYAAWYQEMMDRSLEYHPEDDPHNVTGADGEPVFPKHYAYTLENYYKRVFAAIPDPCAICIRLHKKQERKESR